ncbi:MAG: hypothetical protein CL760_00285 [Chloroflexi bacterium]|nr:hypothetical protein [Chloroflexota bacterium]|tara:strand:+ start:49629 stop:50678 length:1050 start_codon:yes stop_codon:yes gene_type:complete
MEVGIALLLILLGYNLIDSEAPQQLDNKTEVIEQTKEADKNTVFNKNKELDFQIISQSDFRFFENNYQIQVKQYHHEGKIRITDSISTLSLNSAKTFKMEDVYKTLDKNNIPYEVFFEFKTKLTPNLKETEFDSKYKIEYSENYSESNGVNSKFEFNISSEQLILPTKPVYISHKNYEYEITLKEVSESETFKNVDELDCEKDITCEILKENTIFYKTNKNKPIKIKKTNNQRKSEPKERRQFKEGRKITFDNYIIHKVEKGDTISDIAYKYNSSITLIKKINNLKDSTLKVDQDILVANKTTILHKIGKGENLFKISKKYNKKMSTLRELNDLKSDVIYEDYILIINF